MEAVGAGAGVVAFITFALKSTKTIYETASSIKNGPAEIENLASEVCRLQSVLTHLSKLPDIELAESELGLERFNQFSSLLETCHKDVSRFAQACTKVHIQPEDKKVGVAWKKIKTVLKETEFRRMRDVVSNYVTELGVQLSMIQCNTGSFCKDKLIHLTEAMSERADSDRTHKELMHQAKGQLRDTLPNLKQKMDHIPEMTAMQFENIRVLLKALQDQVSGIPAQIKHPEQIPYHKPPSSDVPRETNDNPNSEKDQELVQSIERLCQLAKQKEGTVSNKEAEIIADDLDALLDSVHLHWSHGKRDAHTSKKRSIDLVEPESSIDGHDLKRMRSLLTASDSVVVNKGARPFPFFRDSKVKGTCKTEGIQTANGKILMTTKRRQWCAAPISSHKGITTNQENATEFTGTITAIFDQFQANLTIRFHQHAMAGGYLSPYPSISVGMTLPDDSPIFGLVEDGDMNGLLNLLSQGEASLRDRDSLGRPLLHYALREPEVCKFLIENGADVDEIARWFNSPDAIGTPLSQIVNPLEESEEEEFRKNECRRLLFNAGADPTIYAADSEGMLFSPLDEALISGPVEILQLTLDLGGSFIDLEERCPQGDNVLLKLAAERHGPEMFAVLLRRGANPQARNSYTGDTCLHICIRSAFRCDHTLDQESLILLVKYGADVNACNYNGESVSEFAYICMNGGRAYRFGGYRGDLWDAVLSESGYDITEMRKGFPRRPQYTEDYTREDFERLWRGREEFCPYYLDPPIWCPHGIEELESSEEDNLGEELEEEEEEEEEDEGEEVFLGTQGSLRNPETAEKRESHNNGRVLDDWGLFDGNTEGCQKRTSKAEELECHYGSSTKFEEGSPTEMVSTNVLPPLRVNTEATIAAQRSSLPPLASIFTTPGVSTMEPASPWQHSASSSQMAPTSWRGFDQTYLHNSISGSTPTTWQDWPAAIQITKFEHDLQAELRSGDYELEPNPWL